MANLAGSRKRATQAESRRKHNVGLRSRFRTHIKAVVKAIEQGDSVLASEKYKKACSVADATATKKLIHGNKAARLKSRLNRRIKQMTQNA